MNKSIFRRVLWIPVLLLALALMSCGQVLDGSGNTIELNYDHKDFNSFDLWGAVDADIQQTGDVYSVTIKVDDNIAAHVISRVEGGKLRIGLDQLYSYRNLHFSAVIRIPADVNPLSLTIAEAAKVDMNLVSSGNFVVNAGDAATLNVASGWTSTGSCSFSLRDASRVVIGDGMANSGNVSVNLRDASSLDFGTGTANGGKLDIVLGEASRLYMGSFDVFDVVISARSASVATVRSVGGAITGSLSDASSLTYKGTPSSVAVQTSGASSLIDGR
jgi:hypothetical protein